MDASVLEKSAFQSFIAEIAKSYSVYLPSLQKGAIEYTLVTDNAVDLKDGLTRQPLKKILSPQNEIVTRYNLDGNDGENTMISSEISAKQTLVLGVKPCDARSVALNANPLLLDPSNPHKDGRFQQHKDNLIIAGLACSTPCADGFCRSVGVNPAGTDGMDLLLLDLEDSFYVQVITEKGAGLTSATQMRTPSEIEETKAQNLITSLENASSTRADHEITFVKGDINALFDLPVWEELSERCLNCGICTNLCPTCTCFDLLDYEAGRSGYRFQVWDSCMVQLFTQQSSGYNPRKAEKSRVRQRFMHKLQYYPEKFGGLLSCVGCGRCVRYCPVNIDIREVASQMTSSQERQA